nr:MAG: replication initiator protein [Microviridae sp.]
MCLYPRLIKNPKYKKAEYIPQDERIMYVPVGCNDCIECNKKRANNWKIRLKEEIKKKELKAYFVTLTFSTEELKKIDDKIKKEITGYNRDNSIAIYATRHFLERWRKKYKKSLRHWFITELGHNNTEHIHIHGIVWTNENFEEVRRIWQYGFVYPRDYQVKRNYVNNSTISYIIKYVTKKDIKHKYYKNIILTSAGIGNNYKINGYDKVKDKYKTKEGYEISLPIYYRNKIYSEEEREKQWIKKLDEGIRWVNGQKVKANDIETINKLLIEGQKRSKEKGYRGTDINWQEKEYENQQRELLRAVRYNKKN